MTRNYSFLAINKLFFPRSQAFFVPPEIICLGEILVEIMRAEVGVPHSQPGIYRGPYPSGAPAIFIAQCATQLQKSLKKRLSIY